MKRILISAATIIGLGTLAAGGTGAFFSDAETATGNTLAAGTIDLKVDNESYYNGAISSSTTWLEPVDLTNGRLFLNFTDIKPDDEGEDTISLHVGTNDAWACMDIALTSNDDVSSTEPEIDAGDTHNDTESTWDGELAQHVDMFWWADDGDNVYETGEGALTPAPVSIAQLFGGGAATGTVSLTLADASTSVWGIPGPIPGDTTRYLGKAWCFGDLVLAPLAQDGIGKTATSTNGPLVRGTGLTCNGLSANDTTQTDALTMDIAFRAVQARHNAGFTCGGGQNRMATLTVVKQVTNNNGGNNVVPDFQLFVDNGVVLTHVTSGASTTLSSGVYNVTETGVSGYVATFGGDCSASGQVILNPGDNKTCILTNDDLPANITLIKNVINDNGGIAGPTQFGLRIDGALVQNNTSVAVTSNTLHTITEDGRAGYSFVSITGNPKCPAALGGTTTLNEGESITCTITNNDNL